MTQDFQRLLQEQGLCEVSAELRQLYESPDDQVPFPCPVSIVVDHSPLHGLGLIATRPFQLGQLIAPARIHGKRTPAGRYANHADSPNATMIYVDGDVYLRALTHIPAWVEITVNYRWVLSLNQTLSQKIA